MGSIWLHLGVNPGDPKRAKRTKMYINPSPPNVTLSNTIELFRISAFAVSLPI